MRDVIGQNLQGIAHVHVHDDHVPVMLQVGRREVPDRPDRRHAQRPCDLNRGCLGHRQGRDIDIIHLNGSIELAPILSLSDVIVDIVETGTTLKENALEERETIVPISARLIANKASYKFQSDAIRRIVESMAQQLEEQV